MQRKPPVGTRRPSGEDDVERVERTAAPKNQVPADGALAKTKGGRGSGRAPGKAGKGRPAAR